MMKKIICAGMAVAMMAALAIPASATDASNTTTVKFSYNTNKKIDPNNTDSTYKITIPAEIKLKENGTYTDGSMKFVDDGDYVIKFSGCIGQQDDVQVSVKSTNGYKLTGSGVNAEYTLTPTASDTKYIQLATSTFSGTNAIDIGTCNASGFANEASIDLKIESAGTSSGIFGKCEVTDTLTFDYTYGQYDADKNGITHMTHGDDGGALTRTFEYAKTTTDTNTQADQKSGS